MTRNKIVVRYLDGRVLKGHTADFLPTRPTFHVEQSGAATGAKPVTVALSELKAAFFVRELTGDASRNEILDFQPGKLVVGRRVRVLFKDGETIVGTTQGYDPKRAGFFVVPASAASNNERCFVVVAATQQITFL